MTVSIQQVDKRAVHDLITTAYNTNMFDDDPRVLDYCLLLTTSMWSGTVDGKFACAWGLIPPTILSDQAYLWLYSTDVIKDHEFLFIRHSQRMVEKMLNEFPLIAGHASIGSDRSIRWLRWLGAVFSDPQGQLLPFTIRKK